MSGGAFVSRLKRDLGTVEAYAALIGILVGAGIFRVTGTAFARTGPSVILGYVVLAPAIVATSIPYAAYLSTPLGREPGGEYAHISRTLGTRALAFLGAWLKLISYVGAAAFLAGALADYTLQLGVQLGWLEAPSSQPMVALAFLALFWLVNSIGVRWFGRVQVGMCVLLGVSIIVLVVPGLFHVELANYTPHFTGGAGGFAAALPPLFFAFAGFESLAHSAGEVKDSTRRLPRIFLRGVLVTTLIFVSMSIVAFGVLPGERLIGSAAPMAEVAAEFLPRGAAEIVTLGGVMAVATSLNATLIVPSRLAIVLARDGLLPPVIGEVNVNTGTPLVGLAITFGLSAVLLISGQMALALNIAVFALVVLYGLHSTAFLLLRRRNPELHGQLAVGLPGPVLSAAALFSVAAMGTLVVVQVVQDVRAISGTTLVERFETQSLTSVELFALWGAIGVVLYVLRRGAPRYDSGESTA